jgi:hypothetical protein
MGGEQRAAPKSPRTCCSAPLRWGLLALVVSITPAARAHNLGDSYLYLKIYEKTVTGRFEIALSDLNSALGLPGTEGEITAQKLDRRIGFLQDYYLEHVRISTAGRPLTIRFTRHGLLDARGGYVLLHFELDGLDGVPDTLTFDYSVLFDEEPSHRGFVLVEHNWATGTFANENQVSLVFSSNSRRQKLDLTSTGRLRGFLAVARLGAEHLVLGVDHVMFLFALLLPTALRREGGRWRPTETFAPALGNVLRIVTAFLVAHSLAFSLSAPGLVSLPGRLVETAIALSITLAAVNLLVPLFLGRLWWIVFGLSLFHGFGFAAALQDLGVLDDRLGLSLLAFNLGAEIGQVAVAAALLAVLFPLRRLRVYHKALLPLAAAGMILVSGVWAVERAFGVDVPMGELLPGAVQGALP